MGHRSRSVIDYMAKAALTKKHGGPQSRNERYCPKCYMQIPTSKDKCEHCSPPKGETNFGDAMTWHSLPT
jgi:hypothetical protein